MLTAANAVRCKHMIYGVCFRYHFLIRSLRFYEPVVVFLIVEIALLPLHHNGISEPNAPGLSAGCPLAGLNPVNFIFPAILPDQPKRTQLAVFCELRNDIHINLEFGGFHLGCDQNEHLPLIRPPDCRAAYSPAGGRYYLPWRSGTPAYGLCTYSPAVPPEIRIVCGDRLRFAPP